MPSVLSQHPLFRRPAPAAMAALALSALLGAVHPTAARAQFLIDPTGGTNILNSADDSTTSVTLPFSFNYYGTDYTSLYASSNGNLNANGANGAYNYLNGTGVPLIDGLGTDLVTGTNEVSYRTGAGGAAFALSYQGVGAYGTPTSSSDFQIALFGASATVGGFSFQPGDIALSYGNIGQFPGDMSGTAAVGLASGNSTQGIVALPGGEATFGRIDNTAASALLPNYATTSQFLLFRPNGAGSYTASVQTTASASVAAPEPGSIALAVTGALPLLGAMAARRRRRAA